MSVRLVLTLILGLLVSWLVVNGYCIMRAKSRPDKTGVEKENEHH